MSYTALYRKYRPAEFTDVKGQDHIVTTLRNQIMAGRIGHAYLFCGTRGTGKTTVAKIFARAVNCQNPLDGSPCGECEMCRRIKSGASLNVIEIDAASNNSVENVRQIREEVTYPPTEGKYKVYIIDEVHMLSTGAFNALLKTLEEPPAYVIFVLATTEAHKIPITILSRCQRYDFHRITADVIADRLMDLMREEGNDVEEDAIRYIAKAADGSMRDALSLLDQCISFYLGQKLTYENVLDVLGAVDTTVLASLAESIRQQNTVSAMAVIEEMVNQGRELSQFVTDFIWYLRSLLLVKASDRMDEVLEMSPDNISLLKEVAQGFSDDSLMRYIRIFSELLNDMRYAAQKRILLEIAVIRLIRPAMERTEEALLDRLSVLERRLEEGIAAGGMAGPAGADGQQAPAGGGSGIAAGQKLEKKEEAPLVQVRPEAVPEDIRDVVGRWHQLTAALPAVLRVYARQARLSLSEDGKLVLVFEDKIAYTYVSDEKMTETLCKTLADQTGKEIPLRVVLQEQSIPFERNHIDLSRIIHNIEIEVED